MVHERSLLHYFLPVFRADFSVLESSSEEQWTTLPVNTYLLWGEDDPIVSLDTITQWANYISGPIQIIPIEKGSHMFIHDKTEFLAHTLDHIISKFG